MAARFLILTGAPGCGKTTVAAEMVRPRPRGLHIPADGFWTFLSQPISPYRPAARQQNEDVIAALVRTAATFAGRGYDVVLDGIFGPWFLPVVVAEAAREAVAVDYVVLTVPLDLALQRVRAREGSDHRDHVVRQMDAELAKLGPYETHALAAGDLTPGQIVAVIEQRRGSGALALAAPG